MNAELKAKIAQFHQSPYFGYITATGAGSGIAPSLLAVSGASASVAAAFDPYKQEISAQFIGHDPVWWNEKKRGRFYSREFACQLAGTSYFHAEAAAWNDYKANPSLPLKRPFGFGLAAAIGTNRIRKGEDRISIALRVGDPAERKEAKMYAVELALRGFNELPQPNHTEAEALDAVRDRHMRVSNLAGLNLLFWLAGIEQFPLDAEVIDIEKSNVIVEGGKILLDPIEVIPVATRTPAVMMPDGSFHDLSSLDGSKLVILPITANPLTFAHVSFLRTGVDFYNDRTGVFWINRSHAEKDSLSEGEIQRRLKMFIGVAPVIVTDNCRLHIEKARLMPGAAWVIGADNCERLLDYTYYGSSEEALSTVLDEFADLDTEFQVMGRPLRSGRFLSMRDLAIPNAHRGMFNELSRWSVNVSSTEMRELARKAREKKG